MLTRVNDATQAAEEADAGLLNDLRQAVSGEGLSLSYQPLVRSGDGEIIGFEALLRWNRDGDEVSPGRFVPIAERAQLMPQIGRWVIATAARQVAEWQRVGLLLEHSLHVNLSGQELLDPALPGFVAKALTRAGLRPEQFCFEVTEADLRAGGSEAEQAVEAMVAAGYRPVLDDFGVSSTVEILTLFPFEYAKIDHGLLAGEHRPRHWARLLRGIGGLARSLNITLIVEGVENEEEMSRVAALGFAHAQGYAFGRPESAGEVGRSLADSRWNDVRS